MNSCQNCGSNNHTNCNRKIQVNDQMFVLVDRPNDQVFGPFETVQDMFKWAYDKGSFWSGPELWEIILRQFDETFDWTNQLEDLEKIGLNIRPTHY